MVRRNKWRVQGWRDEEDLLQDGAMVWTRVCVAYPHVKSRAHLMALYKAAYQNHFTDLARLRQREPATFLPMEANGVHNVVCEWSQVCTVVCEAPADIRPVLEHYANAVISHDFRRLPMRWKGDGTLETMNTRFCRVFGLQPGTDVINGIRAYLGGR